MDETSTSKSGSKELKRPTTYYEQVEILKNRNLIIKNEYNAIEILKKVNYYRLSAYFLSIRQPGTDLFKDNTTFDHVYRLYEFDSKLRNILMVHLEGIEISFRTHIAYTLAHKYGALGYEKSENFANEEHHVKFLREFNRELDRQKELFIKHHILQYDGQFPVWVVVEIISFGALSKLYSNMKTDDQKEIANEHYRVPHEYIASWLKVLSYIRNVCAHFGRLYNKTMTSKPRLFKEHY